MPVSNPHTFQPARWLVLLSFLVGAFRLQSQGYDLKFQLNGLTDSTVYLARYFFDQVPIVDSSVHIKHGAIRFKGSTVLESGVYIVANQQRNSFYLQFIIDGNQKFTVTADVKDMSKTLKSDDAVNNGYYSYIRYLNAKNAELYSVREKFKGRKDSAQMVLKEHTRLDNEIKAYEKNYIDKNSSSFVSGMLKIKREHYPTAVPKASNGRPDSVYQYFYYRDHYFDEINFKDDRLLNTPFFAEKIKAYFDGIVPQQPDSVIKDFDNMMRRCTPGSTLFNTLIGHFTYQFETNKEMIFDQNGKSQSFEKVFVHLCENYIVNGKTGGYYDAETIVKIKERIAITKNLLPGSRLPEFYGIDTANGAKVLKMGFDTARTSEAATELYRRHQSTIVQMLRPLTMIRAKYVVVVFWAADCGHCKTAVPLLSKEIRKLQTSVDVKVVAVQTKEELYNDWKKFIVENQLDNFYHLFDPIHINNLKEKFDITATPVIYLLDQDYRILAKKIEETAVADIIQRLEEIDKNRKKQ